MDIFPPIFQLGCFIALLGFTLLNLDIGKFKNGPPDAVIIISSIFLLFPFSSDHIEKCYESTGTDGFGFYRGLRRIDIKGIPIIININIKLTNLPLFFNMLP